MTRNRNWTRKGINNVVLQTMACTMGKYKYNDFFSIYTRNAIPTDDIEFDVDEWKTHHWLTYGYINAYYTYDSVSVRVEAWPDIVKNIVPDQLDKVLRPVNKVKPEDPQIQILARAYVNYTHGLPFVELLNNLDYNVISDKGSLLYQIFSVMVRRPGDAGFLKCIDGNILSWLFYVNFADGWINLKPTFNETILRQVFLDNELLDSGNREYVNNCFLLFHELPKSGKLQDLIDRAAEGSHTQSVLMCIKMMHEEKPQEALAGFSALLKQEKEETFGSPISNFAYAIAMGLNDSPLVRKTAEKLMKNRKVKSDPLCYPMLMALHHYFKGDALQFYHNNPISDCENIQSRLLATLFMKHFDVYEKDLMSEQKTNNSDLKRIMSMSENWVASNDYSYYKLLYSDDFTKLQPIAEQLRKATGLANSLLPKVKKQQKWELVIEQLMKINKPEAAPRREKVEMERVAYMVDVRNYEVQPKLQKSKDGGITWSKGRNISLQTFQDGNVACMTLQDHAVSKFVEQEYGWYSSGPLELCGNAVLAALIGCQSVFRADTEQRIDIVEEPLQLVAQPTERGYTVKSNVNLSVLREGIYVELVGDKQFTVIRVSENQKNTISILSKVNIFPEESKKQLTELLQSLSKEFTVMSPLLKNAKGLKSVEPNSLISVQVAPIEDQHFNISLAVKPFGDYPPYQRPGKGMEIVSTTIEGERVQTERDLSAEQRNLDSVRTLLSDFSSAQTDEDEWCLDMTECLQLLEKIRTASDVCFVEWPKGVKMRVVRPLIGADQLNLKISSAGQWFELEGDIKIDDKNKIKVAELMELVRSANGNFIRLSDDEYVALSEQLRRQLQAIDKMLVGRGKGLKLATMNGMQLSTLEEMGAKVKADEQFRQLMKRIKEASKLKVELPANIHAELRPYQVTGYEWMCRLAHWGAGACLADDMGLGKTLQAITLMQSRAHLGPQLVVMPTSLLHNWQSELQRFAPALTVKLLNPQGTNRQQIVESAEAGDIVLSTYGLLVTEGDLLCTRTWTTIVLDEAHSIKNRETQTSKSAMNLTADFRLMLTGTPLQNHLNEIWNLFQFANPGLLGSFQQFADRFILPIERDHDQERQRLLRQLLSPFMLRRTKDDVLSELPEKTEITLRVELSPDEQALYDNLRQQAIANLEEGSNSALQTLAEITRLRQAACHPRLINPKLPLKSSKTKAFLELVEELRQSGHRALVFSQFTSHLALVREELDSQKIPYLYLDGSTSAAERNRLVRKFQTGSEPLFLISLKAGGLGLNLTAADYVIHLDPWWNPAVEDQASDRAHRIGQQRPVTVYRLISAGTIEEKIIRLHQNKRSMADALLQDADLYSQISAEDVIRLLREGNLVNA